MVAHPLLGIVRDSLAAVRSLPWQQVPWTADSEALIKARASEPSNFDGDNYRNDVSGVRAAYTIGPSRLLVAGDRPSAAELDAFARVLGAFPRPYTIVWFMHGARRQFPVAGSVGPTHINGGYCMACDPGTIVIYRREDAVRVLIHELQHASCLDNHKDDEEIIEAKTEAWAEIIYAMLAAVRLGISAEEAWRIQSGWAAAQNRRLRQQFGVNSPAAYAWRYTVGKEVVWRQLGLPVAEGRARVESLQLGAPQLDVA